MSDNSLFNQSSNGSDQNQNQNGNGNSQPNQNDQLVTMLASIRNENGEQKYKTVEDAMKALLHSQQFIPQLQQEAKAAKDEAERLRTEAAKITQLEATVAELLQGSKKSTEVTPPVIDEAAIADVVQKTLTKTQAEAVRQANLSTVVKTMQEKFGTEVEAKFYGKAQELGMSKAEINELAAKSPAAVFQIFGITDGGKPTQSAPNQSTVNTSVFNQNPDTKVGANKKSLMLGATSEDIRDEQRNARAMVDELHAQGKSVHDLTDPRVYFATFKR